MHIFSTGTKVSLPSLMSEPVKVFTQVPFCTLNCGIVPAGVIPKIFKGLS